MNNNCLFISSGVVSKIGGRAVNEDSYLAETTETGSFFAVADGLGGCGMGNIASRIATEEMKKSILNSSEPDPVKQVEEAILSAQASILREQQRRGCPNSMKTTAVALCISGGTLSWGHIGDSRLYMFSGHRLSVRTLDHSIPQLLVLTNKLPERKIRNHPQRNMLLRVLGVEWDSPRYELSEAYALQAGQSFLLCSDGFWELINERQMQRLLKKTKTAEEWLAQMTALVEKQGRKRDMDNYTAVTVRVEEKTHREV